MKTLTIALHISLRFLSCNSKLKTIGPTCHYFGLSSETNVGAASSPPHSHSPSYTFASCSSPTSSSRHLYFSPSLHQLVEIVRSFLGISTTTAKSVTLLSSSLALQSAEGAPPVEEGGTDVEEHEFYWRVAVSGVFIPLYTEHNLFPHVTVCRDAQQ